MRGISYSCGDAEEKSEKFLKYILGQENYDKIIKDGKLEVNSNKNVYELYLDGRVVNKTTNQKYCIVPDRPDYPNYDVVAIKYAWLKYGVKTVEKVANKSVLLPPIQRTVYSGLRDYVPDRTVGYDAFIHYMEENGWHRTPFVLKEHNTSIITTHSVQAGSISDIIKIRCPVGNMLTMMGTNHVPEGGDMVSAYSLALEVIDNNQNEISPYTRIRIAKIQSTTSVVQLVRCFYADLNRTRQRTGTIVYKTNNELWRWRQGVALHGEEYLNITLISPETAIRSENVKMNMDCDLWSKMI